MAESSIYDDYFKYTDAASKKYGPKSVVLMQVGAFYEMYGLKNGDSVVGSRVSDIASVCGGLAISEKKTIHSGFPVVMAGFRDYTLDRHAQRIVESGYTALVYDQHKQGTKFVRTLTSVLSAGTYLSNETTSMTNYIMCVWIDIFDKRNGKSNDKRNDKRNGNKSKKQMVCGVAAVNIISGKSVMFEYESPLNLDSVSSFDELDRCVSTYLPSETIVISPYDTDTAKQIASYAGIQSPIIHYLCTGDELRTHGESNDSVLSRCTQQVYLRHVLETYFQKNTYDVCSEFQQYCIATQAYCYLLHFIHEHNTNLIRKIALPSFHNGTREMVLANHTLKQLNIIDDLGIEFSGKSSQYRSVSAFLNRCCTAVGRRHLFEQLTRPVFDTVWLNREYDAIDWMLGLPEEMHDMTRKQLAKVADLERIERQVVTKRAGPETVARLYHSLCAIDQLYTCFLQTDVSYMDIDPNTFPSTIQQLMAPFEQTFVFCGSTTSHASTVDEHLFKPGVDSTLDALIETQKRDEHLFVSIRTTFNRVMSVCEKSAAAIDYIKVHDTEKSGSTLQITKKRAATLKTYLAEMTKKEQSIEFQTSSKEPIRVLASEIRLVSAGTTNDELVFPMLTRILRERMEIKDRILAEAARVFQEWLQRFELQIEPLRTVVAFVARIDVLQSKSYVARKYNYCRPTILSPSSDTAGSRVETAGLRHCLIEHIQTKEIYVPNDISIGNSLDCEPPPILGGNPNGILLYGTNAVGKTSLIRAVGISVVMAQAGMYVPATSFVFSPYRAIFSRILGNDNLFKNLSTFAVEMSELRTILKHADQNSLILGDELCSGTESESALSIFMAGLMDLQEKGASFLFATHFHEILKFSEMQQIAHQVHVKHMAVHYDRELDRLVYDRVLKDGPGNRVYGLEVAKSLHLPPEFIETAYRIRQKYYPDTQGPLANTPTKYNAKKIRGMCELCKVELAEETHHILQQKDADERGFFENTGVHKNHPANLMGLCSKCHDAQHATEKTVVGIEPKKKLVLKKKAATLQIQV